MNKIGKNRPRIAMALASAVMWVFGSLAGPGMVFCVTGPDHAAFEPVHYGLHKVPCGAGDEDRALGLEALSGLLGGDGLCTDIPVSGFALSRPHSDYQPFMKVSTLPFEPASHHYLWTRVRDNHEGGSDPFVPLPYESHLRTTVLLI